MILGGHIEVHDYSEAIAGFVFGAVLLGAAGISRLFRDSLAIGIGVLLIYCVVTEGPEGIQLVIAYLMAEAERYPEFASGLFAGNMVTALLQRLLAR